jgi:hypothetical protein
LLPLVCPQTQVAFVLLTVLQIAETTENKRKDTNVPTVKKKINGGSDSYWIPPPNQFVYYVQEKLHLNN